MRQRITLAFGILFSALFLWLALRGTDMLQLTSALRQLDVVWVLPFIVSLGAFCWCKAMRWTLLLGPVGITRGRDLLPAVVIGYMGTGLMPMQLGEVARAYIAAVQLRTKIAPVLATLMIERVLDVFALLVVVGVIGLTGSDLANQYRAAALVLLGIGVITLLLAWAYGTYTSAFEQLTGICTAWLPERWREGLLEQVRSGSTGVQAIRNPGTYLGLIFLSLIQWSCMCSCIWISLAAAGQMLPVWAALAVLATTILAMTLPSGPGYVGSLQLAFVLALTPFGVDRGDALAASFFYLAALWIPLVAGGMFLLHRMGLSLNTLRAQEVQQHGRN